jgi:hypothetical protein
MGWTDSQDYGADEILSHPFTLTQTVQRVACALPFEGSFQESTEIIQLIKHQPTLFNLSRLLEGCDPRFSRKALSKQPRREKHMCNSILSGRLLLVA